MTDYVAHLKLTHDGARKAEIFGELGLALPEITEYEVHRFLAP